MNTTKIIDSHRELLDDFCNKLDDHSEEISEKTLSRLREAGLSRSIIDRHYTLANEGAVNKVSYIHALRDYLQKQLDIPYEEAIDVISEVFKPKFLNPENPYYYKAASKSFLTNRVFDIVNARSEWRAYFEFRFLKPVRHYMDRHLPEHWLTLNFNLFSFIGNQNLPAYRMHTNVPDQHKYKIKGKPVPYDLREEEFNSLLKFQGKYSTVWEIVKNNVSSIFYFDKTAEHPSDMIVYEIEPDVSPGAGSVDAKFVSRFYINGKHRNRGTLLDMQSSGDSPEQVFDQERQKNEAERDFQYSIMRFFIRGGIFNPENAAYHIRLFEPGFKDLLKSAFGKFERIRNKELPLHDDQRRAYMERLLAELGDISFIQLQEILKSQFASSKNPERSPKKDISTGVWSGFEDKDKYSVDENRSLDLVIALIDLIEPEALNVRMGIFETGFFSLTQKDNTISHIYWMPIIINWRTQFTGGAVFLNSDKRIDPKKVWAKYPEADFYSDGSQEEPGEIGPGDKVPQDIISILYYMTGLFTDKQIGEIEESIQAAAERSAAVSIMSRNISHNIGSHVLSYLKNLFSDEANMLKEGVLENLIKTDAHGRLYLNDDIQNSKDRLVLPYLRSIGRLLGYFQERQDYIGTFASDRYLYFSPLHFQESVVENFCGKTRVISADGNLIKETRNLALDYIINSEGYRQDDIEFHTQWMDEKTGKAIPLGKDNDIEIALPSGNTGRQGIYTILENFIRNSAKHGSSIESRPGKKMVVTLTLIDAGPDFYKLEIADNSGNTTTGVVETIKEVLKDPLIRADGNPDERHKGIKEIQIAAGWLRGVQPHDLLNNPPQGGKNVLEVDRVSDESGECSLKYTIHLRKPKPGLLIVSDSSKYFEPDQYGRPSTVLKEKFRKSLEHWVIQEYGDPRQINPDKIPYRFVIVHRDIEVKKPSAWKKTYLEILKHSPARVLAGWTDEQLQDEQLSESLYRAWLDSPQPFVDESTSRFGLILPSDRKQLQSISDEITIGIEDPKRSRHFEDETIKHLVVDSPLSKAREQDILFREHNDQPLRFDAFCEEVGEERLRQYLFVEGISGDNSTDRVLRHEVVDQMWRYKMIEAALTKIIIIDERVWKNNFGDNEEERERNYLRWEKKNVHILSLEFDTDQPGYLCLKDLRGDTVALVDKFGNPRFTSGEYEKAYRFSHFISLHQGLLERAVKHCSEGLVNMTEQEQVNELFRKFRDKLLTARFRVIIHSGRSKTHILPYPTAFVQLSSLGSALRDSKLTLCELFYSTIQEENTAES